MWSFQEGFDNFNGFRWHLFNMSRVYHAENHPTCFGLPSISTMANDLFVCWICILNTKPTQYLSFAPPKQRCTSKSTQTSRIFKSYFSFRSWSPLFFYIYIYTYTYTYCFLFFCSKTKLGAQVEDHPGKACAAALTQLEADIAVPKKKNPLKPPDMDSTSSKMV